MGYVTSRNHRQFRASFYALLAGLGISLSTVLRAELKFDTTTLIFSAKGGERELAGAFKFTNTGPTPVEVLDVTPSCGCTTAALAKKTFAPGESAELKTTFTVDGRQGTQTKYITIATNETERNTYTLTLQADIPITIDLSPRLLMWNHQAGKQPKQIEVTTGSETKVARASETSGKFAIEIRELKPGVTRIIVTPLEQGRDINTELKIDLVRDGQQKLSRKAFLRVLPDSASVDPLRDPAVRMAQPK